MLVFDPLHRFGQVVVGLHGGSGHVKPTIETLFEPHVVDIGLVGDAKGAITRGTKVLGEGGNGRWDRSGAVDDVVAGRHQAREYGTEGGAGPIAGAGGVGEAYAVLGR